MGIEERFDIALVGDLARREKQIQQNYRPVIGVHKWFARRPGALFRALFLAEFNGDEPLSQAFFRSHHFKGKLIADPFMGGGTPLIEANRLGCDVIGCDVNPMAYWVVRQELNALDRTAFRKEAERVIQDVEHEIGTFYKTNCLVCGSKSADVKYLLWVKQATCDQCRRQVDLFPGYLIATNDRHTHYVIVCRVCGHLNELEDLPGDRPRSDCRRCGTRLTVEGPSRPERTCSHCGHAVVYPQPELGPPTHRMFALEYHCARCRERHIGRYFKAPDRRDLKLYQQARRKAEKARLPFVPRDGIPLGDETTRLHKWGYRHYRELFNARQIMGLNALAQRISRVKQADVRHALATVLSDILRYQNMLVRYDTWALKALDIFSVHGYPVGLVQCESSLIGIPGIGSGGFRHFVEKYDRAKAYCEEPFETVYRNERKHIVPIEGERILAHIVDQPAPLTPSDIPWAWLDAADANTAELRPNMLDAVFTDPPYFANVQYAELMDFCYVWLRKLLGRQVRQFAPPSTRTHEDLTGNLTLGRTLEDFTAGLSRIFSRYASALKPGAPFVFTYHHNKLDAYVPIIVAILDANLVCTESLPCPAEMGASIHINGTSSSVIDTIFVCRGTTNASKRDGIPESLADRASHDLQALQKSGLRITLGDARCVVFGHVARLTILRAAPTWQRKGKVADRLRTASSILQGIISPDDVDQLAQAALAKAESHVPRQMALFVPTSVDEHTKTTV